MILEYVITSIQLHISRIEAKASIHMVKIRLLQTTFSVLLVSTRAGYCGPKYVLRYIAISKKVLQYIAIFINLIWKCF